ncbi:hypothetical protein DET65_2510 [Sunxiuqinia elliptica]|uniref:Attachment p12 family protein n=1 Tax=Sunxiuqinia elliptica TaxID=655355 RepID=A0A4V3BX42_9BACT|nr:hypothetical protein DET52_11034 [Sunxiuqinia elliptica]TDO60697.1 hypothetical protein DET65_2510 [Sunxiuqinia elliptica]
MAQEIITYVILLTTFGYVVFRIYKTIEKLQSPKDKDSANKCGSCGTGCSLKDLPTKNPECPPGHQYS